jgi:hypothetical protein
MRQANKRTAKYKKRVELIGCSGRERHARTGYGPSRDQEYSTVQTTLSRNNGGHSKMHSHYGVFRRFPLCEYLDLKHTCRFVKEMYILY